MLSNYPMAATLPAQEVARAKEFYQRILGFHLVFEVPETGECIFETGQTVFLVYPSMGAGTNQATAAAWRVDDLARVVSGLRERGIVFEEYDYPELKTVDGIAEMADGTKVAWFKDSEGNILAIDQLPPGNPLAVT